MLLTLSPKHLLDCSSPFWLNYTHVEEFFSETILQKGTERLGVHDFQSIFNFIFIQETQNKFVPGMIDGQTQIKFYCSGA